MPSPTRHGRCSAETSCGYQAPSPACAAVGIPADASFTKTPGAAPCTTTGHYQPAAACTFAILGGYPAHALAAGAPASGGATSGAARIASHAAVLARVGRPYEFHATRSYGSADIGAAAPPPTLENCATAACPSPLSVPAVSGNG